MSLDQFSLRDEKAEPEQAFANIVTVIESEAREPFFDAKVTVAHDLAAATSAVRVGVVMQALQLIYYPSFVHSQVMLFDPVLSCDAVLQRCLLLCHGS